MMSYVSGFEKQIRPGKRRSNEDKGKVAADDCKLGLEFIFYTNDFVWFLSEDIGVVQRTILNWKVTSSLDNV